MPFSDHLVEPISRRAIAIIPAAMWVTIGETIAAHQDEIMYRSRQLQRFLHLPTCTHIFSEADSDIHQDDVKVAAIALSSAILFVSAVILCIFIEGLKSVLNHPLVVCSVFALMATPGLVLWLRLALTCRRRQRNRRGAVAWGINDASTDDSEVARGS